MKNAGRIIVGVSGASGAAYARRALEALRAAGVETHLVISKAAEMAMVFRARHAGESKLDSMVSLEFLLLLADKVLGRLVPLRFVMFILVGITGLVLHLSLLAFFFRGLSMPFLESQVLSTLLAMTSNFFLNNKATYRDRRLAGRSLWTGLLSFCLVCSVGAVVNFMVASFLFAHTIPWMLAGLVGAGASSVWNYAVTAHLTWTMKRPPARIHLDGEEGSLSANQIPASLV